MTAGAIRLTVRAEGDVFAFDVAARDGQIIRLAGCAVRLSRSRVEQIAVHKARDLWGRGPKIDITWAPGAACLVARDREAAPPTL